MKTTYAITGSRDGFYEDVIQEEILSFRSEATRFVIGDAKGVDSIARQICDEHGFEYKCYMADWERFGRAAGPIRDKAMIDEERPYMVLAFHKDWENSKGTKFTMKYALFRGINVLLFYKNSPVGAKLFTAGDMR